MRAWIPAVAVAILMAAGLGLAAYLGLRYSTTATTPSPALSFDLHSKEAVVAAIRHYYEVEAKARETGNGSLIDAVTTGAGSLASQNFKAFIAAQAAANRRSVVVENHVELEAVSIGPDTAIAGYLFWLNGHDTDAASGRALEADSVTARGRYRATLALGNGRWLVRERRLVQDNVP